MNGGKNMSGAILEMKNISKNFGSVIALKNVNLEVYPGEIWGLIGENGSGKSTISSIVNFFNNTLSVHLLANSSP